MAVPAATPTGPAEPGGKSGRSSRVGFWILVTTLALVVLCPLLLIMFSRESANRAACKGNLSIIRMGLLRYADEHGGEFSPSLAALYPKYVESTGVFSCPAHPSRHQDFAAGAAGEESSGYVYLPGRTRSLPGSFVLAFDKFRNHGSRGANVLFVDGSVAWCPAERLSELQKILLEQQAQLLELRLKDLAPEPGK